MIEKGKIYQVWDKSHDNVIKYSQVITDKENNKEIVIEGESLNDLMTKVRSIIEELKG